MKNQDKAKRNLWDGQSIQALRHHLLFAVVFEVVVVYSIAGLLHQYQPEKFLHPSIEKIIIEGGIITLIIIIFKIFEKPMILIRVK